MGAFIIIGIVVLVICGAVVIARWALKSEANDSTPKDKGCMDYSEEDYYNDLKRV